MKLRLDIDGSACLLLALLCLTIPLNWLGAAILAALVHEACHILAVFLLGGKIHSLRIGASGAVLESTPMEPVPELISILSGPAGSILLFFLYPVLPRTALCALVQGLFNLLPVMPLDGGRALGCICRLFLEEDRAEVLCLRVRWIFAAFVTIMLLWAIFRNILDISSVIPAGFLLWLWMGRKIPCKESKLGVQ